MAAAWTSLEGPAQVVAIVVGAITIALVVVRTDAIRELAWSLGFVRDGPVTALLELQDPAPS